MNHKNIPLLNRQGSKRFNVCNMRPFVKLTKKQYKSSSRLNYVYALEYKKKLYRQNLINNLLYNSFQKNKLYFDQLYKKQNNHMKKPYLNLENMKPFLHLNRYCAFLNGSSLWAIQKQTTALKVFPQSSLFWAHALDHLDSNFRKVSINKENINRKHKLWTAGFVRIRKLRLYYTRQLQSTQKILYWLGDPSLRKLKHIVNQIDNHNARPNSMVWSIICFLDSLQSNILIKSNFVYNSSASPNVIKQKAINLNGFLLHNAYSFSKPANILYKI